MPSLAMLEAAPIVDGYVAEVRDWDVRSATPDDVRRIEAVLAETPVLVFRDQLLSDDQLAVFGGLFGPLTPMGDFNRGSRVTNKALFDLSNVDEHSERIAAESQRRIVIESARIWHVDSSYRAVPDSYSMLYGRTVPPIGGDTEFADARAALEAMDVGRQHDLERLIGVHSTAATLARMKLQVPDDSRTHTPVYHPVVRVHPHSGRKALYVASHMSGIVGMDAFEANALIDDLLAHVGEERFVHAHKWAPGDVVLWDNRSVLHRGTEYDIDRYQRDIRQIRVSERDYRPLSIEQLTA
jgi:alpha-ketoglutarate-dependent 2,4-dichlorophenoxyacetate dioxygenase